MNIKGIIKFDDNDAERHFVRHHKIVTRVKYAMNYLLNHLPINELDENNSFDFENLKFDEGKNYNWYFLNKKNLTILVRQYRGHFTFFTLSKRDKDAEINFDDYFSKLGIFTIHNESSLMDDATSDAHCDNPFLTLETLLPQLVEILDKGSVHSIWNDLCFERPKYTKVKIALTGEDSVSSLDTLNFACDEICSMFAEKYAENEVLEKLKTLKVGDDFGKYYTITKINTEVNDGYYHAVGLYKQRKEKDDSKPEWADVYSLARYYYDELYYDGVSDKVEAFLYKNHETIFKQIFTKDIVIIWQITGAYKKAMYELFVSEGNVIEYKDFCSAMPKSFESFVENCYRVELTK